MTSGAAAEPDQAAVVLCQPTVRPGTPEARADGWLCRSESTMEAGFRGPAHGGSGWPGSR
jgi:hypothetical protein